MQAIHLSKRYQIRRGQTVCALTDVNFRLPDCGMIFVVGKTGCGKTTLLNLFAGLDEPTEGKIYFVFPRREIETGGGSDRLRLFAERYPEDLRDFRIFVGFFDLSSEFFTLLSNE